MHAEESHDRGPVRDQAQHDEKVVVRQRPARVVAAVGHSLREIGGLAESGILGLLCLEDLFRWGPRFGRDRKDVLRDAVLKQAGLNVAQSAGQLVHLPEGGAVTAWDCGHASAFHCMDKPVEAMGEARHHNAAYGDVVRPAARKPGVRWGWSVPISSPLYARPRGLPHASLLAWLQPSSFHSLP